jgi:hypothetical protein
MKGHSFIVRSKNPNKKSWVVEFNNHERSCGICKPGRKHSLILGSKNPHPLLNSRTGRETVLCGGIQEPKEKLKMGGGIQEHKDNIHWVLEFKNAGW